MRAPFEQPWIWALLGILGLFILLSVGVGQVNLANLTGIVTSAGLLCVVALGQMLVVTTGDGAVDLSIPNVMTLSAFVATSLINGADGRLPLGLVTAAVLGASVGCINALIVNRLRIPPIIATLAVGYILTTGTLIVNRGFQTYAVSPLLAYVASRRAFGIPVILLVAMALASAAAALLHLTVYGRNLSAVGQNRRAAYLAGVPVERTTTAAYALSGALAAVGGVLLSGRVGGAFLEMGNPFLLQSVGAVVVGGSSILGGRANAFGTLLGSVFLVMVVTTMQVLRLGQGFQEIAQGVLLILVLAVATVRKQKAARTQA
ncbi:MAG: ABC transporter permease [Verrucomicrobia bacterium]|nr:ABC transporter permease [Verrucomicrobiota bacterium]